ncbi:hypothetical protein TWF730_011270 [Orbilia blumenaviensis]|uniref:Uncharacterized protein n=1 Tax=Orbilia blumenaviensis TaxID=1796055 RepID=A0AAV9UK68_9PEZI
MKFFTTIVVAALSVAALAAPAPAPNAEEVAPLEKRAKCAPGLICYGGKCHLWYCTVMGCSVGGATRDSC